MKAPTGAFPPNKSQVGGTESLFVCHVPGPRGNSLGYFCPSRAPSRCFSQAPGASRSQHRLFSFLRTKYGHVASMLKAVRTNGHGHRPTNTGMLLRSRSLRTPECFSAPEAALSEVEQRFDRVQARTHMYPSLIGGGLCINIYIISPPSPRSNPLHR
jgi:hypothetical protein